MNPVTSNQAHQCYIGLGSNLDQPINQIKAAVLALSQSPNLQIHQISSLYESKAFGPTQPNYINAVAEISTTLEAEALLDLLQSFENMQGRVRDIHWGPRTLDLDLLLYGQRRIHTKRLKVPHPEMLKRAFVLVPLTEITVNLRLPDGNMLKSAVSRSMVTELSRIAPPPPTKTL